MKQLAWAALGAAVLWALVGCQGGPASAPARGVLPAAPLPAAAAAAPEGARTSFSAPEAWGGQVRCAGGHCRLALVEHGKSEAVLHRFEGRGLQEVARAKLGFHPDSAIWLNDQLVAAAVEVGSTVDILRAGERTLEPVAQLAAGFNVRDVLLWGGDHGVYDLLAVPYNGEQVAWLRWREGEPAPEQVRRVTLCQSPWHPVKVSRAPQQRAGGIAVGCLDDRRVMWASPPESGLRPRELARFAAVPRQVRPSPSGRWLYVALETGARNARIDMDSGAVQFLASPLTGALAVAPITDDLVAWSEDRRIYLQQFDAAGAVVHTRWLPTSGFGTGLQLVDVDGDGQQDLLVLNSAGEKSDVLFGPLWAQASERQP